MNSESIRTRLSERHLTLGNMLAAGQVALELASETTPKIDEQFLSIAGRVASQEGALFSVIDESKLTGSMRPDGVRHNKTYLPPNALTDKEITETLSLVDIMLGDQVGELKSTFSDFIDEHNIFDRIKSTPEKVGEKFIIVSNHIQIADQGFTMGLFHKAAREKEIDRLENLSTAVIGRAVGYFQFGELNVIDDVLRKVGSVLKTFPSGGSESLSDEQQTLMIYRGICNHHTKQAFSDLISSRDGRLIYMAPSGEQDKFDSQRNVVIMSRFSKSTSQLIIDACNEGATVIPIFVDYGNDASLAKFLEPRQVRSQSDCDEVGQEIARAGTIARITSGIKNPHIKRFGTPVIYE